MLAIGEVACNKDKTENQPIIIYQMVIKKGNAIKKDTNIPPSFIKQI